MDHVPSRPSFLVVEIEVLTDAFLFFHLGVCTVYSYPRDKLVES